MRTKLYLSLIILLVQHVFTGCNDDYLERYPLNSLSPETFFTTSAELENYTNAFYSVIPDAVSVYNSGPAFGDDEARTFVNPEMQGTRITPTTGGGWSWGSLRTINFYLENSHKCSDEAARLRYDGVARFFRTYFYLDKLVQFGDVPWYDYVLNTDDETGLMKARDPRAFVFQKMLEDIDFAIANCVAAKEANKITKWTAMALKSRMCLFEGTFRKYHGLPGWEEILSAAANVSEQLMESGTYSIYTADPNTAYQELFIAENALTQEVILARQYSAGIPFVHEPGFHIITGSSGAHGMAKALVNSYLMKDGSRFTDLANYNETPFFEETTNRDPRLSQTIRTPGYKRIGQGTLSLPDFAACVTGYQFNKYIPAPQFDRNASSDIPVMRYAEVLLNYAEAKAELGTLQQSDLDKSINRIRARVSMPDLNMAAANAQPDPFLLTQYVNIGNSDNLGVLLEIRRERRVELVKEGFRFRDLLRWREGHLLASPVYGMYFPGTGDYDLDGNGTIDLVIYEGEKPAEVSGRQYRRLGDEIFLENGAAGGRMLINSNVAKSWNENKDYLYPLPLQELQINRSLTQNPGWEGL